MPTVQTPIGEFVAQNPGRSRFFEQLGLEYCCGGKLSLQDACAKKGLDAATVLATLEAAESLQTPHTGPHPAEMTLTELADHIVDTHHAFLNSELPRLAGLTRKVAAVHGEHFPWLRELHTVYAALAEELSSHLAKEEVLLFPAIRNLDAGRDSGAPFGPQLERPVLMMEHEHAEAGAALAKLRELSGGYAVPEGACNSFRAMLSGLEELERDTHEHISKENNVLFPRALARFSGVQA